jgi:hypothetical protein
MNAYIKANNLEDGSFTYDVIVNGSYEFINLVEKKINNIKDRPGIISHGKQLIVYADSQNHALEILENAKRSAKIMVDRWGS